MCVYHKCVCLALLLELYPKIKYSEIIVSQQPNADALTQSVDSDIDLFAHY